MPRSISINQQLAIRLAIVLALFLIAAATIAGVTGVNVFGLAALLHHVAAYGGTAPKVLFHM